MQQVNYTIGVSSNDPIRLLAAAMILHSAGVRTAGLGLLMESGRPTELWRQSYGGSSGSLHVSPDKRVYKTAITGPQGSRKNYSTGFFNLDDPVGFSAFARTVAEKLNIVTTWTLSRRSGGTYERIAQLTGHAITVGCTVVKRDTIREMVEALEGRSSLTQWTLRDASGYASVAAIKGPDRTIQVLSEGVVVSLYQLQEMLKATS